MSGHVERLNLSAADIGKVTEVIQGISQVNGTADTIASDSAKVSKNAEDLAELARVLKAQAGQFTV